MGLQDLVVVGSIIFLAPHVAYWGPLAGNKKVGKHRFTVIFRLFESRKLRVSGQQWLQVTSAFCSNSL